MTSTALSSTNLRPDEKPLAEYRAVSRAAVVAAGLGAASALVLLTPLLAPLALAAALMAVLALRAITASGGQLVGRLPAVAGLCLAALFLGWSTARHFSRQAALETSARQSADLWLSLIQKGQLEQALQFRLPPQSRVSEQVSLKEYYQRTPDAKQELQAFAGLNAVKALIAAGPRQPPTFDAVVVNLNDGSTDQLRLKYTLQRSPEKGGSLPLWVYVNRRLQDKSRRGYWEVTSVDTTPPPSAQ